jgi:hypothetical protein
MTIASEILNEESTVRNNVVQIPTPSEIATYGHRLDARALYGQAREFVQMILPHTEADPAALLANFLVGFGSIIGRNAFFKVESTKHYGNLFLVLVGESSNGRKGTSWNRVKEVLALIDPEWAGLRIHSGLSSGEGLIMAVSDSEESKVDPRLLVYQPEFASTLAVMARQGNNLSPIIRESWDSGSLQTMVKQSPLRAEGAHVSMIGHITREELRRNLNNTETGNGFANRFLWIRSERSKYLPDGGSLPESEIVNFANRLRPAVEFARQTFQLQRDPDARILWHTRYEELSNGPSGLVGAVTSRAVAQVLRLSMLYALLDCSPEIREEHLKAALAFWDYAAKSAEWVFGSRLGDPVADKILEALRTRPSGMPRTEISALFSRNHSALRIDQALESLADRGLAFSTPHPTGGRNVVVWEVTPVDTKNTKDTNKLEIIR